MLEQGGGGAGRALHGRRGACASPFNPWIFHVRAGYADEAEHMVQQLTTLGINASPCMYQDDGFGKAGLEGVRRRWRAA